MGIKHKFKSRNQHPNPESSLPLTVEAFLQNGAPEGSRNNTLFGAAAQCRDIAMPQEEAEHLLVPKAMAIGLSESESRTAIQSAYAGAKREPAQSRFSTIMSNEARHNDRYSAPNAGSPSNPEGISPWKRREIGSSHNPLKGAEPVQLPEPFEEGFEAILLAAFEEGEGVCVGGTFENEDGEMMPDRGVTLSREMWLEKVRERGGDFARMHTAKDGHYLRINPMRTGKDTRNGNDDVTSFRHVLVEFDKDTSGRDIPKEKQLGAFLASGLPITAILDSGGRSLHAWVRIDAEDKSEYEERAAQVYGLFEGENIDEQVHNPSRYSRCPDGIRTMEYGPKQGQQVRQRLLRVNAGCSDWEEWERQNSIRDFGEEFTIDQLLAYDYKNDPNTVLGDRWLCRGGTLVIVSQSGVGKSSLQRQLESGWALDRPDMTFGIKPKRPLKQLLIQAENDIGDMAEVVAGVREAFDLTPEEVAKWRDLSSSRRITEYAGAAFLRKLEALVLDLRPDLVWIDPLNNFIGDDISKADVVSNFCVQGLNTIANRCGTTFVLIHHTGKPKDEKYMESASGSDLAYLGLGSSILTNNAREVLVMPRIKTPNEDDPKTFRLVATKRGKRAGMMSMMPNGDPMGSNPTDSIFIRHSDDGRIYWKQCPKPVERKHKPGKKDPSQVGAGSSLSVSQKIEIMEKVIEDGGKLTMKGRAELADKFKKSARTIANWHKSVEEGAALAGKPVDEFLSEQLQKGEG